MLAGSGLILIGALFLLRNLGIIQGDISNLFWPLLIILIGISMVIKGAGKDKDRKNNIREC